MASCLSKGDFPAGEQVGSDHGRGFWEVVLELKGGDRALGAGERGLRRIF